MQHTRKSGTPEPRGAGTAYGQNDIELPNANAGLTPEADPGTVARWANEHIAQGEAPVDELDPTATGGPAAENVWAHSLDHDLPPERRISPVPRSLQ